jgi:hypothetical protein
MKGELTEGKELRASVVTKRLKAEAKVEFGENGAPKEPQYYLDLARKYAFSEEELLELVREACPPQESK